MTSPKEKLEKRRILNKAASARCREKKLKLVKDLEKEVAYWKRVTREKELECNELKRQLAYYQKRLEQREDPNVVVLPEPEQRQSPDSDLAVCLDGFLWISEPPQKNDSETQRLESVSPFSCIDIQDLDSMMSEVEDYNFEESWNNVFEPLTYENANTYFDHPMNLPPPVPQPRTILKPINGFNPSNRGYDFLAGSTGLTPVGQPVSRYPQS